MPTYTYKCTKGHVFEEFLSFSEYDEPQICGCGAESERYYPPESAPTFQIKGFDAYESPSSGKIISNDKQRRDDLARTGCVEYDPEIKTDHQRNLKEEEAALDSIVDEHVEKEFSKMDTKEKEMMHKEMENTTEEYTRI